MPSRIVIVGTGDRALVAHTLLTSDLAELPPLESAAPGAVITVVGGSFRAHQWCLRTKYYSADIELCVAESPGADDLDVTTAGAGAGAAATDAVEALIVTYDATAGAGECAAFEAAKQQWAPFVAAHAPDVALCVGTGVGATAAVDMPNDITAPGAREAQAREAALSARALWCFDHGMEHVLVDTAAPRDGSWATRDKEGLARVLEALQSHMWSAMQYTTRSRPAEAAEEAVVPPAAAAKGGGAAAGAAAVEEEEVGEEDEVPVVAPVAAAPAAAAAAANDDSAAGQKAAGNALFAAGDYGGAIGAYGAALLRAFEEGGAAAGPPETAALMGACYLNTAACHLKLGAWAAAERSASASLALGVEPTSRAKGLYRRGLARARMAAAMAAAAAVEAGAVEAGAVAGAAAAAKSAEAVEDLEAAAAAEPRNKSVQKELRALRSASSSSLSSSSSSSSSTVVQGDGEEGEFGAGLGDLISEVHAVRDASKGLSDEERRARAAETAMKLLGMMGAEAEADE
jgi:hypothetical protein